MDANKSVTVRIAPQDLETLKHRNLKLFVARPVGRFDGYSVVWRIFDDPGASNVIRWDEDYSVHAAAPAETMEAAGSTVALWFGEHAEPGTIVDPTRTAAIVVDVSTHDSAVVDYADGRWSLADAG